MKLCSVPLCIHHLKHSNTQHNATRGPDDSEMQWWCFKTPKHRGEKTWFRWSSNMQLQTPAVCTSQLCLPTLQTFPLLSKLYKNAASAADTWILLGKDHPSAAHSFLTQSAPSAPKPVATIRSIYFPFNTYHVVFSFLNPPEWLLFPLYFCIKSLPAQVKSCLHLEHL